MSQTDMTRTGVARFLDEALATGDPQRIERSLRAYAADESGAALTARALPTQPQTTFTPVEDAGTLSGIYVAPGGAMVFGDTAEDQDAFFRGR